MNYVFSGLTVPKKYMYMYFLYFLKQAPFTMKSMDEGEVAVGGLDHLPGREKEIQITNRFMAE